MLDGVIKHLTINMHVAHVKKYCEETSLHGLKYITENDRNPFERILWISLCFSGLCLAVFFIQPRNRLVAFFFFPLKFFLTDVRRYIKDPTTTTLASTDYPIWNIDFPGITICPNMKVIFNIIIKIQNGLLHRSKDALEAYHK